MAGNRMYRIGAAIIGLAIGSAMVPGLEATSRAQEFNVKDLVTDATDSSLINPWGVSFGATSPFWISDNGTGVSTLYTVNPTTDATTKAGLIVTIPGDGTVTGQVFNTSSGFNGDAFLFVSEDGTISGWRNALGTNAETLQVGSSANVYKGVALDTTGGNSYLLSANFRAGTIDVLKANGAAPNLAGTFTDPNLPTGYAPFNVRILDGVVYVTYALQDASKHDDVAGASHGYVNAFDLQGNLLGRVAGAGLLDSPWGLAIAPTSFGALAGDLLVGNFGDGRINVINPSTDAFLGQLIGTGGQPLAIDGLWSITVGNNGSGGSSQKLYFTAGPNDESGGVFGVITAVPEPGSALLGLIALGLLAAGWRCDLVGRLARPLDRGRPAAS